MKKVFLLIASAFLMFPAFAQNVTTSEDENTRTIVEETNTPEGRIVTTTVYEKNSVFTNGFWRNWTLSGNLGAQLYYGDNDWKVNKLTEMITFPAIDVYLTKWASPSFGVGLGVSYGKFLGLYQSNPMRQNMERGINGNFKASPLELYKNPDPKWASQQLAYQRGNWINAYVLAHADLGNIFFGYKPDRFFDIDAFAGGGLIFGLDDEFARGVTYNMGFANMFRITDRFKINLNIRGAFVGDEFDGESYIKEPTESHIRANHKRDGIFGATLGFTYGLDKHGWRTASRSSEIHYNDAVLAERDRLAKALADANAANDDLKNRLANAETVKYVKDIPEVWFHINFVVDKWDIAKREMINLQSIADLIKSTPNTKYLVCGYADKQTATPEHNLMLSENRANAVYDVLVNQFGVPASQVVKDWKGGVDYMFYNEKELSRCVMINSIQE
ncbi:MAG: OmpA family protein [Bacteroidales bacterium]|nr:OmpA family protein [Bacteroidales bacterium]